MNRAVWALPLCFLCAAVLCAAQPRKYSGPVPPKEDLPYLLHASKLEPLEEGEVRESKVKDDSVYTLSGAASPARTPLAEPIFILKPKRLNPDRLQLYRMEIKGGQRSLTIGGGKRRKDDAKPVFLMVTPLEGGLYRIEVNEPSENGEYCLSPEGSNQTFCFGIY